MKKSIIILAFLGFTLMSGAQNAVATDAVLVSGTKSGKAVDESFLCETDTMKVTFDADGNPVLALADGSERKYEIALTDTLRVDSSKAYRLQGYLAAGNGKNYSTFFSSECAWKVPETGATACAARVARVDGDGIGYLKLTALTGAGNRIVHMGEPVIVESDESEVILLPSVNKLPASVESQLSGTDEAMECDPAVNYAFGQWQNSDIGFFPSSTVAANSAYLAFDSPQPVSMYVISHEVPTGVKEIPVVDGREVKAIYNVAGQQLSKMQPGVNIILFTDGTTAKVMR